jgi:hypothetical protein
MLDCTEARLTQLMLADKYNSNVHFLWSEVCAFQSQPFVLNINCREWTLSALGPTETQKIIMKILSSS